MKAKFSPRQGQKSGGQKKKIRHWVIMALLIVSVVVVWRVLGNLGSTTEISVASLPCYTHQDVTIFGNDVLYYDGASIHCVATTGSVLWSYQVGSDAEFSASDDYVVIWQDSRLFMLNHSGRATYNSSLSAPVQFARIGKRYCVVVSGEDTEPVITVMDFQGVQVDQIEQEVFSGMLMLDAGFYGDNGQYLWTLAMDVYGPAISTSMNLFQVGKMNMGIVSLGENLVYKVLFDNSRLRVFSTQNMYAYDYKGVQDVSGTMLVYGWQLQDISIPDRGDATILLAPTAQTSGIPAITELRALTGQKDRYYTLPSSCVGAAVEGGYIYAFSGSYLYRTHMDSQRFYAYAYNLSDNQTVNSFIGLTNGGQAIVSSGSSVFAVSLPQ